MTGRATGAARRTPPATPSPTSPASDCSREVASDARLPVFADRDVDGRSGDPDRRPPGRPGHGHRHVVRRAVRLPARASPVHGDRRRPDDGVDRRRARRPDRRDAAAALRPAAARRSASCKPATPGARRITAVDGRRGRCVRRSAAGRADRRLDGVARPAGRRCPAGATDVDITIARRRRRHAVHGVGRRRRRFRRDRHRPGADGRGRARAAATHSMRSTPDTPLTVALTRLRVDPMDRWRSDPEPRLVREFDLPPTRTLATSVEVRVDRRASDQTLAAAFGWPAWASSRLTGSIANAGVSAIDGDPATSWITGFGGADRRDVDDRRHDAHRSITSRSSSPTDRSAGSPSSCCAPGRRSERSPSTPTPPARATAIVDPPLPPGALEIDDLDDRRRRRRSIVATPTPSSSRLRSPRSSCLVCLRPSRCGRLRRHRSRAPPLIAVDGERAVVLVRPDRAAGDRRHRGRGEPCAARPRSPPVRTAVESRRHRPAGRRRPGRDVRPPAGCRRCAGDGQLRTATVDRRRPVPQDGRGRELRRWVLARARQRLQHGVEGDGSGRFARRSAARRRRLQRLVDRTVRRSRSHVVVEWTQQRKLDIALVLSLLGVLVAIVLLRARRAARRMVGAARTPPQAATDRTRWTTVPRRTAVVDRRRVDRAVGSRDRPGVGIGGPVAGAVAGRAATAAHRRADGVGDRRLPSARW